MAVLVVALAEPTKQFPAELMYPLPVTSTALVAFELTCTVHSGELIPELPMTSRAPDAVALSAIKQSGKVLASALAFTETAIDTNDAILVSVVATLALAVPVYTFPVVVKVVDTAALSTR
jgi:hypothetical protein